MSITLADLVATIAERFTQLGWRLVLAESCTAGLVAATLAERPGASNWLCGSAVVYREATKTAWLGVPEELLAAATAVSQAASNALATGALECTPEATLSLAITGHFGPDAPAEVDGHVFLAVAQRRSSGIELVDSGEFELTARERVARQRESVAVALRRLARILHQIRIE